ncbi:MAG: hypothetical protein FJ221_07165 [Lentisphaerae bacterium]|nr:hypothetical protein [Lentisphaerota bacterium]
MNDTHPRVRGIARRNRPVHVARRDACVERATEMLIMPLEHMGTGARIDHVSRVIHLLEKALGEAELAARGGAVSPVEQDFTHFLNLILANVRSADAFLDHQAHLESDEHSFLTKFLGIGPDEIALAAMNYQRLSVEVLAALWQMLRLMHVPYHTLQQKNQGEFDEADRARYQTAYQHLRAELQARPAAAGA